MDGFSFCYMSDEHAVVSQKSFIQEITKRGLPASPVFVLKLQIYLILYWDEIKC